MHTVTIRAVRRHQCRPEFTWAPCLRHGHGTTAAVPREGTGSSAGAASDRGVRRLSDERSHRPTLRRGLGKSRRPRQLVRREGCQSVPPTRSRRDRPAGGILCSGAAASARVSAKASKRCLFGGKARWTLRVGMPVARRRRTPCCRDAAGVSVHVLACDDPSVAGEQRRRAEAGGTMYSSAWGPHAPHPPRSMGYEAMRSRISFDTSGCGGCEEQRRAVAFAVRLPASSSSVVACLCVGSPSVFCSLPRSRPTAAAAG